MKFKYVHPKPTLGTYVGFTQNLTKMVYFVVKKFLLLLDLMKYNNKIIRALK